MDLSGLYSALASQEAIESSCITIDELSSERVGCIVGSGVSNTEPIYQAGAKLFSKMEKLPLMELPEV